MGLLLSLVNVCCVCDCGKWVFPRCLIRGSLCAVLAQDISALMVAVCVLHTHNVASS
jgi:hypothetical protein